MGNLSSLAGRKKQPNGKAIESGRTTGLPRKPDLQAPSCGLDLKKLNSSPSHGSPVAEELKQQSSIGQDRSDGGSVRGQRISRKQRSGGRTSQEGQHNQQNDGQVQGQGAAGHQGRLFEDAPVEEQDEEHKHTGADLEDDR